MHLPIVLVYAVYLEKSADEARTATTPFALISGLPPSDPVDLLTYVANSWIDSNAYIAVSAMDFAGNESPRSAPFLVNGSEERHADAPSTSAGSELRFRLRSRRWLCWGSCEGGPGLVDGRNSCIARIRLRDGTISTAELLWYEAHGIGRKERKIKRLLP